MSLDHLPPTGQSGHETHGSTAGGHLLDDSQSPHETQDHSAVVDLLPTGHRGDVTQCCNAGGQPLCPTTNELTKPSGPSSSGTLSVQPMPCTQTQGRNGWTELRIAADLFDRAQHERIAVANIIRRPEDGGNIDPVFFAAHLARLEDTEHQARLMMRRTYKRIVPTELREWQKTSRGVGDDLFARLLGHLGDPYIATPHYWQGNGAARALMAEPARVRTIGQLWQYAGHGDPHRRKAKGMTADDMFALGSPIVKMLVHLNAEACMKQPNGSRYRDVYLDARAKVLDKTHTVECVRCGPSGKPAQPGTAWSLGHQHAHALRIVGKELLRDMWLARHTHESETGTNP